MSEAPATNSPEPQQRPKRTVGLLSLTFIAAGGILGSGWLFAPLLTAQLAGPASLIAWGIGAVAMMLLANSFAEVSGVMPVAGGIARIPRFTHGDVSAAVIGWTAWFGYSTQAPIEVAVMLQYLGFKFPFLFDGVPGEGNFTATGYAVAGVLLLIFVIINFLGASFFARMNQGITWIKFVFPIVIAGALLSTRFEVGNFTEHGGFFADGGHGILAAVSSGGVIFALIGFRHAIDMAGEAKNPSVVVPLALILGLLIPVCIYFLLQVAFIGALTSDQLANGWQHIHITNRFGPLAAVAMALGISWLSAVIYGGAVLGPFGGGLVATGSTARITYALARNHFTPSWLEKLSKKSIPTPALLVNFVIGIALLVIFPFREIVAVNSAAITLSFVAGPIAVYALRKQLPDAKRTYKIRGMKIQAVLGFIVSSYIIYWSGWKTNIVLMLVIVASIVFLFIKRILIDKHPLSSIDSREAIWLIPFLTINLTISYLGNFGDGLGVIPFGWDIAILGVLSGATFFVANWCRLSNEKANAYREKYKNPDIPQAH